MKKAKDINSLLCIVDTLYDFIQNKLSTGEEEQQKKIANLILRNLRYQQ